MLDVPQVGERKKNIYESEHLHSYDGGVQDTAAQCTVVVRSTSSLLTLGFAASRDPSIQNPIKKVRAGLFPHGRQGSLA
jgi:hypothetical protein